MIAVETKTKRAVGYSRTSSENDTSLETQREQIKAFVKRNGWKFICQYEDKCKSGAKIEGRDDFQRMIKDARDKEFDVIVVFDISRFARDGSDIIGTAKFLKEKFDIDIVDTKATFDTQDRNRTISNFMMAGFAEYERIQILDRTTRGRIKKAEQGLPWCPHPPTGRAFDKEKGRWIVTDEGKKLAELLARFVDGEPLGRLVREYGISSIHAIHRSVRKGQLSGKYFAIINAKDIGIVDRKVEVPGIPSVITPQLERRLKVIFKFNQKWNKQFESREYPLIGFIKCAHCGRLLRAQTVKGIVYYRHFYKPNDKKVCPYKSVQGDLLEDRVLSYLYNFFFDKTSFNEAIQAALPKDDDRKALVKDIKEVEKQITAQKRKITNLVNAIAAGADVSLLLSKQDELKANIQGLVERRDELQQTLEAMPDPEDIWKHSVSIRAKLRARYKVSDWQEVPYEDVRRFLHFLFGYKPKEKGFGISVGFVNGKWNITTEGEIGFDKIPKLDNV